MGREYTDEKVVIWGLGVNGGGLASALFFLEKGIKVIILDDKSSAELAASVQALTPYIDLYTLLPTSEFILREADLVIKNPGIRTSHPLLKFCRRIETDISLFLEQNQNPLVVVTGSKGKSSLVTLVDRVLKAQYPATKLGGNITHSPLNFVGQLDGSSPVVLELSSWQLGDLPAGVLKSHLALITNLYHDHQNTYAHFDDYVRDKMQIFENQSTGDVFFCEEEAYHNHIQRLLAQPLTTKLVLFPSFPQFEKKGETAYASLYLSGGTVGYRAEGGVESELFSLPADDLKLVRYEKMLAGALAHWQGVPRERIEAVLTQTIVVPHRLEWIREVEGVDYYNDSAATLPEATIASAQSLLEEYGSLVLMTGGTDKELDFTGFNQLLGENIQWVLLAGSATLKLIEVLEDKGVTYTLWDTLEECLAEARYLVEAGEVVLFSPAAASFEKFKNEFDRGNQFKELVDSL